MRSNLAVLLAAATLAGTTAATTGTAAATTSPVRVDVGSGSAVTSGGLAWSADRGATGGTRATTSRTLSGTDAPTMARSYRYGMSAYRLPVTNGTYDVRLHLLEPYWTAAGKRVFDVTLEGTKVLDDVDVFARAGGRGRVIAPVFRTTVTDGRVDLGFAASRDKSVLAGLEVLPVAAATSPTAPVAPAPLVTAPPVSATDVPLSWAPPALTSPTTVHVTNSSAKLSLDPARDYVVALPSTPLTAKGGLQVKGGRNVVVIGGEIRAPRATEASATDRRGLLLAGQTGTVHVEGVRITGDDLAEGIQLDQRLGAAVQIQNVRVETVHGTEATNHADVLQTWAGPRRLLVDRLTGSTGYQGFMLNPNDGAFGGTTRPKPELFDFRRVDLTGNSDSAYLVWLSKGTSAVQRLSVSDVWLSPAAGRTSRDSHIWPKPSTGDRSWDGARTGRPATPFVPVGTAGIGYRSPGYVS